jgi:cytochrome oxidase Cu insertion factor (SCO1/SenC/PrrC family)
MMKSVRFAAAVLPMLALCGTAALAEQALPTTLMSLDANVVLTGTLTAADAETFTLETVAGVYLIRRADVNCSGFCPEGAHSAGADAKVAQSG